MIQAHPNAADIRNVNVIDFNELERDGGEGPRTIFLVPLWRSIYRILTTAFPFDRPVPT
ncbi:hypothetical protein FB004_104186 [Sinorhizobium medicae]|nr:hypothetical protein FB004_104186 [Sinorhizobium medicae]TWA39078.1 hypothetical protein FB007_103213 [Sinorhizobium medicae]TWA40628.1 hypothetical protein FB009_105210 [Sinorhizobium medicae]